MPIHRLDILGGGQTSLNKLHKINSALSVSVEKDKGVGSKPEAQLPLKTQFPRPQSAALWKPPPPLKISPASHLILQADKKYNVK